MLIVASTYAKKKMQLILTHVLAKPMMPIKYLLIDERIVMEVDISRLEN